MSGEQMKEDLSKLGKSQMLLEMRSWSHISRLHLLFLQD